MVSGGRDQKVPRTLWPSVSTSRLTAYRPIKPLAPTTKTLNRDLSFGVDAAHFVDLSRGAVISEPVPKALHYLALLVDFLAALQTEGYLVGLAFGSGRRRMGCQETR